jgi:predicted PurR-regulated permease PerM
MWIVLLLGAFYLLRSVFAVLFASVAIAWLFDPLIDRYERRGHRRESGIGFLFFVLAFGSLASVLVLSQAVAGELHDLSANLVKYTDGLGDNLVRLEAWVATNLGYEGAFDAEAIFRALREQLTGQAADAPAASVRAADAPERESIEDAVKSAVPTVGKLLGQGLKSVLAGGLGIVVTLVNLLLVPVFTFYLLRDWDRAVAGVDALVPAPQRGLVRRVARQIDSRLQAFVRGQLTVCLVLGVLYSVGLLLIGVDLAIAVGMVSGLLFIVPYLGTAVGIVVASGLSVLAYGLDWHLLGVLGVFGGVQLIEGMALTPWIVGDKVGLHPLVVMIALLVGGNLFGIAGMLLAIPATAAAQVLLLEWIQAYRASDAFTHD